MIKRKTAEILGMPWFGLPLHVRQLWWRETDYDRRPPAAEFVLQLPQLLADAQAEIENDKREKVTATVRACEFLRRARQPPCEQCLHPASPCKLRCLRSILMSGGG